GALSSATRSLGAGSGLTTPPALAGSRRPAETGNRQRDSWVETEDEAAPARTREAARQAVEDGACASPRRESVAPPARRRSAKRRPRKEPGGSASPAPGPGWMSGCGNGGTDAETPSAGPGGSPGTA